MSKENSVIIISPHPDDEIIGCYSVLKNNDYCNIIYTSNVENKRREESLKLKDYFNIRQFFVNETPPALINKSNTYYFPDPINEFHPDHRKQGHLGEKMARDGFNVIFYTIQKNTSYIYEIDNIGEKEDILNNVYPTQQSLWKYEKKYILFEGYAKWIFI